MIVNVKSNFLRIRFVLGEILIYDGVHLINKMAHQQKTSVITFLIYLSAFDKFYTKALKEEKNQKKLFGIKKIKKFYH